MIYHDLGEPHANVACLLIFSCCIVPGAHVNPAVSLAMVILGKLPLKKFPVYVVAQFLGAFAGSCAVYGLYYGGCKCLNVITTSVLCQKAGLRDYLDNLSEEPHQV